jgi:hypothetical protein
MDSLYSLSISRKHACSFPIIVRLVQYCLNHWRLLALASGSSRELFLARGLFFERESRGRPCDSIYRVRNDAFTKAPTEPRPERLTWLAQITRHFIFFENSQDPGTLGFHGVNRFIPHAADTRLGLHADAAVRPWHKVYLSSAADVTLTLTHSSQLVCYILLEMLSNFLAQQRVRILPP